MGAQLVHFVAVDDQSRDEHRSRDPRADARSESGAVSFIIAGPLE